MNILKKLSFKYRVYHSVMYTSRLHDAAIRLASELRGYYNFINTPKVNYYEGKYAKINFVIPIAFTIFKKDIRNVMDEYNKSYFSDVSVKKVTNKKVIIYLNFN